MSDPGRNSGSEPTPSDTARDDRIEAAKDSERSRLIGENTDKDRKKKRCKKCYDKCLEDEWCIIMSAMLLALLLLVISLVVHLSKRTPNHQGFYSKAAVAADVGVCSEMGRNILKQNGTAVDAMITTLLCLGVVNPESSGLGGGMFMLIYDKETGRKEAVMARGRAPAAATAHMEFDRFSSKAATIPGELSGMWEAHQRYGRLPWADLFQPVIRLAEEGFTVTHHLAVALRVRFGKMTPDTRSQPKYAPILEKFTHPNGSLKKKGDTVFAPKMARTLRAIAKNGVSELHTGETAQRLVQEIQDNGGIITADDLAGYRADWREATTFSIGGGMTVLTTPSPSGGPVMQFIINVLKHYNISSTNFETTDQRIKIFHRFIEASKFAFAMRSYLGDVDTPKVQETLSKLQSEDYARSVFSKIRDDRVTYLNAREYGPVTSIASHSGGTSHISIVDENGNAVAATSSLNRYLGSTMMGNVTGLILDNHMTDFDTPAGTPGYSANYIGPGKMPLSAMSPVVVINKNGDVELVAGSSGEIAIIPTNTLVVLRSLFTDATLPEIVDDMRIYNQLQPENIVKYEYNFSKDVIDGLVNMQHVVKRQSKYTIISVLEAIKRIDGGWMVHGDPRKQGNASGY